MIKFKDFKSFNLSHDMLDTIEKKGYVTPTPIQSYIIPRIMNSDKNIIGQAHTGTGKTAAFCIPIIEKISEYEKYIQVLILTPTRELALQITNEFESLKGKKDIRITALYGGQPLKVQIKKLSEGTDIIVGTPGRILDHIKNNNINLNFIKYLVLDEADEMLNMGFIDDVKEIFRNTNNEKQMLLFSATMPTPILKLAKKHLYNHEYISVSQKDLISDFTAQIYYELYDTQKLEVLCRIIDMHEDFYGLVFCNTKTDTIEIAHNLGELGYAADALNGDLSQEQREHILKKFKNRFLNILVSTDIASRGIDIIDLTHVINYDLPQDSESYIHRIGRTGRAGKQGNAITFVTPKNIRKFDFFKKTLDANIIKKDPPSSEEIINFRKRHFKSKIAKIEMDGNYKEFIPFAKELLGKKDPVFIIASMLKNQFKNKLDKSNYTDLDSLKHKTDKNQIRLFVASGKYEGMTNEKLSEYLKSNSGMHDLKIDKIEIFSKFSFITVHKSQADILITRFADKKKRNRPFIEIAVNTPKNNIK